MSVKSSVTKAGKTGFGILFNLSVFLLVVWAQAWMLSWAWNTAAGPENKKYHTNVVRTLAVVMVLNLLLGISQRTLFVLGRAARGK